MVILDLKDVQDFSGKCYLAINEDDYLDYKCPKRGEITELIVTNKIRSNGVGQELINKMEEYYIRIYKW